jgi:hypothetical protein
MGSPIGHQNIVGIFAVFEEGQLPGFQRVLGNGTTDHSQAVRTLPGVGLITELSASHPEPSLGNSQFRALLLIGAYALATTA